MAVGSHSGSDSMSYPLAAVKVLPEAKMLPDALTFPEAYNHSPSTSEIFQTILTT